MFTHTRTQTHTQHTEKEREGKKTQRAKEKEEERERKLTQLCTHGDGARQRINAGGARSQRAMAEVLTVVMMQHMEEEGCSGGPRLHEE